MRPGYWTTEFWTGVGSLAAIYELVTAALEKGEVSVGVGIAVGGGSLALAWLASKYATTRTEAKTLAPRGPEAGL